MMDAQRDRVAFWTILAIAILLRAAVIVRSGGITDDPDNYAPLARSLAQGQGFVLAGRPTAYRPPLYPVLLAPLVGVLGNHATLGIAALHLFLGAGTVWLTIVAARKNGLSNRRALVAGSIVTFDPVLIWQARSVMTETPAAFLIAATLAGLAWPGWKGIVLGGVGFGLAGLCRPSLLVPATVTLAASLVLGPGNRRQRLGRTAGLAAVIMVIMTPWTVRNFLIFGEPIWTTTHGGYTLALANNLVYYRNVLDGPPGAVWSGVEQSRWWDSVNRDLAGLSEPEADRRMSREVWKLARDHPWRFARSIMGRLVHFWGVSPASAVYPGLARAITVAWTVPLWIALFLGLFRIRLWRWSAMASVCAIAGLTLVHAFFWTDMRMRAPIVPAIAFVAAGAVLPRISKLVNHKPV